MVIKILGNIEMLEGGKIYEIRLLWAQGPHAQPVTRSEKGSENETTYGMV
jgi:hypothetical protein